MKNFILCIATCCAVFLTSCDKKQCENTNPVFDQNPPESKIYKDELAIQLKSAGQGQLTYWFEQYKEHDGFKNVYVEIQGDGLCAVCILRIDKEEGKLGRLLQNKGVGYVGAEFKNLKYEILRDSANTTFAFRGMDKIVD